MYVPAHAPDDKDAVTGGAAGGGGDGGGGDGGGTSLQSSLSRRTVDTSAAADGPGSVSLTRWVGGPKADSDALKGPCASEAVRAAGAGMAWAALTAAADAEKSQASVISGAALWPSLCQRADQDHWSVVNSSRCLNH